MSPSRIFASILVFAAMVESSIGDTPRQIAAREPPADVRAEANRFAIQLMQIADQVQRQFVREVSRVDLLEAAMQGLYESARLPVPPGLRDELTCWGDRQMLATLVGLWLGRHAVPAELEQLWQQTVLGELLANVTRLRADIGRLDDLRDRKDILVAIKALPRVLDPYSGLIAGRDFNSLIDESRTGVGIEFANAPWPDPIGRRGNIARFGEAARNNGLPNFVLPAALAVKTVIPGSPAQRAGLRPGDAITRVNNRQCRDLSIRRYFRTFYPERDDGQPTESLAIEYQRPGIAGLRTATLLSSEYSVESIFGARRRRDDSWEYLIDPRGKLGYVRVGAINENSHHDFEKAVDELVGLGCTGLLLDLRWCPGGYLTPAKAITRILLGPNRPIASVVYRDPNNRANDAEYAVEMHPELPVLVLVNGETSGGGELIAAALQDHHRAAIAGDRTVGKASVQQELRLNTDAIESAFKISIGTFHRPNGKSLQRLPTSTSRDDWGVQPDSGRWLPLSPALAKKLKEQWTYHILRPGNSTESLPTDDPENDPQLQAAVQMLKSIVAKPKS